MKFIRGTIVAIGLFVLSSDFGTALIDFDAVPDPPSPTPPPSGSAPSPSPKSATEMHHPSFLFMLNLTNEQKLKVMQIQETVTNPAERRKEVMAVLTPDQRVHLKKLTQNWKSQQTGSVPQVLVAGSNQNAVNPRTFQENCIIVKSAPIEAYASDGRMINATMAIIGKAYRFLRLENGRDVLQDASGNIFKIPMDAVEAIPKNE